MVDVSRGSESLSAPRWNSTLSLEGSECGSFGAACAFRTGGATRAAECRDEAATAPAANTVMPTRMATDINNLRTILTCFSAIDMGSNSLFPFLIFLIGCGDLIQLSLVLDSIQLTCCIGINVKVRTRTSGLVPPGFAICTGMRTLIDL